MNLLHYHTATPIFIIFFFFNDTATTEIYTLSLHDALPIYGGVGDGQGGRGAPHPPRVAPRRGPVRRAELRGAAGGVARVGAVRLREGRLHRGRVGARGTARAGRGGNAVSRRSRRDEPGGAGEVPPGAPGAGVSAPRRHADAQGRRTRHRRDEPRPEGGDDPGHVSRGSLLSVTRVRDPPAPAARAPGGHPAPARAFPQPAGAGGHRATGAWHLARGAVAVPGLCVAGERPRAPQRRVARADSVRSGPAQPRASALARRVGAERAPPARSGPSDCPTGRRG